MSSHLLGSLSRLGLSEREARAYLFLLKNGESTAREVSEGTGIPISKVYSVLKSLEEKGWVTVERSSRPARYAPVNPEVAVERAVEQELERKREELEDQARRALRELAEFYASHRKTVAQVYEGEPAKDTLKRTLRLAREVCGIVHVGKTLPNWLTRDLSRVSGPLIVRCESDPPFEHPRMVVRRPELEIDTTVLTLAVDRGELMLARLGEPNYLLLVREPIAAEGLRSVVIKTLEES